MKCFDFRKHTTMTGVKACLDVYILEWLWLWFLPTFNHKLQLLVCLVEERYAVNFHSFYLWSKDKYFLILMCILSMHSWLLHPLPWFGHGGVSLPHNNQERTSTISKLHSSNNNHPSTMPCTLIGEVRVVVLVVVINTLCTTLFLK